VEAPAPKAAPSAASAAPAAAAPEPEGVDRTAEFEDARKRLKQAADALFALGFLVIIGSMVLAYLSVQLVGTMSAILIAGFVIGGLYLALGAAVRFARSKTALAFGVILCIVDVGLAFVQIVMSKQMFGVAGIVIRVLLILYMFKGFDAIDTLEEEELSV
jgi:hypothetical protein